MMALISLEDILYFEISVLGDVSRVSDSVERFLVAMETLGRPDLLDSLPSLLPWQWPRNADPAFECEENIKWSCLAREPVDIVFDTGLMEAWFHFL